ncbi:MAG TPA: hypothetical protein PL051_02775 [Candidatus Saccharibacteria bacterium]|nr:hypothetical protein [Candidatus Saccharibacteria bacterium]
MGPKTSEDDKIGFLYAAIQDLEFAGYSAAQIASIFKNHGAADASSYERGYTFPISILVQTGHFDACMERIVPLLEQKLAEI